MPFKSKKQQRLCYYLKSKGKNKGWNCDEWAEKTDFKHLPERKKKKKKSKSASLEEFSQRVSSLPSLPGESVSDVAGDSFNGHLFFILRARELEKVANNPNKPKQPQQPTTPPQTPQTNQQQTPQTTQQTNNQGMIFNLGTGAASYLRYKNDPKFKSFVDNPINRGIYGLGLHKNRLAQRFAALKPWQQYAMLGGLGLGLVGLFTQNKLPFLLGGLALTTPALYGMYNTSPDVLKRIHQNFQHMHYLRQGQQELNRIQQTANSFWNNLRGSGNQNNSGSG